jgi:hypothetical protein
MRDVRVGQRLEAELRLGHRVHILPKSLGEVWVELNLLCKFLIELVGKCQVVEGLRARGFGRSLRPTLL